MDSRAPDRRDIVAWKFQWLPSHGRSLHPPCELCSWQESERSLSDLRIRQNSDTGRQIDVSLRLPVLVETGIIVPGAFVDYQDAGVSHRGLVRSTQVQVGMPEVWQTLGVQTYA